MGFLDDILYFVIVIGILVVIHELGHFLAARMTGMRAEVFSVGMGFRLFGWNKINGFTFGKLSPDIELGDHTDYRLSLFPIGGYVKIAGMVDESMDTEFAKSEPQPWEFRSKGNLAKAFVLSAGVIMNTLLAILVFAGIAYFEGRNEMATTSIGYVKENSIGSQLGLKPGDKIKSINDRKVNDWGKLIETLVAEDFGENRRILIHRNGKDTILTASGRKLIKSIANQQMLGIAPFDAKTYILNVVGTPAKKAGLKAGDTILAVNKMPVSSQQFMEVIQAHKSKPVFIEWKSGKQFKSDSVTPAANGTIGVEILPVYSGKYVHSEYSIFEAIGVGYTRTVQSVKLLIGTIVQIIKGALTVQQSLGGPIMIAKQASMTAERGFAEFMGFLAALSISLAVINILPFPALDGGHLIFILVETIIRREIPVKIKMAIQQVGVFILFGLMALILYFDIMR